jgi:hypothetical protein
MRRYLRWLLLVVLLGTAMDAAGADCSGMFKAIARGNWEEAVKKGEKCAKDYAKGKEMPEGFLPALQNAWLRRSVQMNTVPDFQAVQARFPGTATADSARLIEHDLVWATAVRQDDVESLRVFRTTYAGLPRVSVAFDLEGELAFAATMAAATETAWLDFLAGYGGHAKAVQVRVKLEDSVFARAVASQGADSLRVFLARYPAAAHATEARWILANRTVTMTIVGPADTVLVRPGVMDAEVPVRAVLARGTTLRLDGLVPGPDGAGLRPALRVWLGGSQTVSFAAYLGRADSRELAPADRPEALVGEVAHVVDVATAWSLVLDRPLRRFPGADATAPLGGFALVLEPPAGVAGSPLVFPVRVEESVPAILSGAQNLLYEQDGTLWLRSVDATTPPLELARLPQKTAQWRFDRQGRGLIASGPNGAARINLATGDVDTMWAGLNVESISEFPDGLLAKVSKKVGDRNDWSLVMDRDGKRTNLIEFGSGWEGWNDYPQVNDRWVAFSRKAAGENTPRVHVMPLAGSTPPRVLPVPVPSITLAPTGSLYVWKEESRQCILHLADIETGKDRVIWNTSSMAEGGFNCGWPKGAPGPVACISAVPGWSPSHWLIALVDGRPQAPVQIDQLQYDLWRGNGTVSAPARPKLVVRNGRTLVGNREVFVRDVGKTPELFSLDITTGAEIRLSYTDKIPAEKRCDSGELIRDMQYSVATTLEHVFYIAYRSGCDGTYGPTFIARIDGQGAPVQIGKGREPPVEVEANWSADRKRLLLSGDGDLVVYDPAGSRAVLAKTVRRGQWFRLPPEMLIGWDRPAVLAPATAASPAPTMRP